ncbi:hypothetical protein GCM10023195_03460 [Actinoallomurus liliacearum]|uniref:Glycosyltransferase n=1 Tax=Actinoallomurus liliacearum TaxID=1080073 RepID=A0ABP8T9C5_9ACTN
MRIVMGAQDCGFGPAAELVAVSRLLTGHERVFVGDDVAAAFARRNADAFDEVHELPEADSASIDRLVESGDLVISVMDADLVIRAAVLGRPAVMVDSLFSFWLLRRPLAAIHRRCASLPLSSVAAADRHLADLSPHERVVAAHLLAAHSVVQNFPGVPERAAEIDSLGTGPEMHLTGPIIDLEGVRGASRNADPGCDLLVNVGGFKNFLLDFDAADDYLRLLHRWIPDLLRDWPRFARVLVCGGPYGPGRERTFTVAGRRADCRLLRQRDLLRRAAAVPDYLLAPGLTALHEAMALGRLPLALPEQHYAHVFTVRRLSGTLFGRTAGRFADVLPDHPVPDDDLAGTAALVRIACRIREDDALYRRFRDTFNQRIEHHLSLGPARRAEGVRELREALDGDPLPSVIAKIVPSA